MSSQPPPPQQKGEQPPPPPPDTNPTALTQTFTHTTKTHSFTINYTSLGSPSNLPLIFIHGTPWSSLVWTPFALSLSSKYHVYIFDNPGFGSSPLEAVIPSAPSFTPTSEIERLDADLARQTEVFAALYHYWAEKDNWGDRKPHVVAHDHAGLMSLRAFLLHRCFYASLCLIDVVAIAPPPSSEGKQPLFESVAENPEFFASLPTLAIDGILESYIRHAAHSKLSDEVVNMLKEPWLRDEASKEGFIRQLCQAKWRSTEEVESRYHEVGRQVPVKIIWGQQDRWISVETADRLAQKLGAREVVKIEGAGHLVMYDQPARLGVELGLWLGGMK